MKYGGCAPDKPVVVERERGVPDIVDRGADLEPIQLARRLRLCQVNHTELQ